MIDILISEEIATACPELAILVISCEMWNTESAPLLWKEIKEMEEQVRSQYKMEEINKRPSILATRKAYKKLGKDPNRYRPSAESLCRRIVKGMPLYQVDTLVDCVNLFSIWSGHSIGAFDVDKIQGNQLVLGVGREGEVYNGIGRGLLNIAGLPVYRDQIGGVGTPTSDEERTKIELTTTKLLILVNSYMGEETLGKEYEYISAMLKKYVFAEHLRGEVVTYNSKKILNL